jgi:hypothetical protein
LIFKEQGNSTVAEKKGSKEIANFLGAYCMGIFWKIHFINPPEVQGQVFCVLIYGLDDDGAKVSKFPIWVNIKIAENVPYS